MLSGEFVHTKKDGRIETSTGLLFDPWDPVIDIRDIVVGLKNTCRFAGQVNRFLSVAQHSIIVARIMSDTGQGDPLEGLLHDSSEAYLGDMPSPFKQFLPDFVKMEDNIDRAVRDKYGLPPSKTAECCKADWMALFIEGNLVSKSGGVNILDPYNIRQESLSLAGAYNPFDQDPEEFMEYFTLYKSLTPRPY